MRRALLAAVGGGSSFTAPTPTLSPSFTVTATKDAGNPTFNFDSIPESMLKVGSTYYAAYQTWTGTVVIKYATATDRDGPWTAGSTLLSIGDVSWAAASTTLYAPEIMEDGGTFYLFYSVVKTSGATDSGNAIGVATASSVTGPYTDSGAAILSPGSAGLWDSRRVGEPSVILRDGTWTMAYMGEDSDLAYQDSEKIGIATASSPTGTWTRASGNPIPWGAAGQFDDALMADPYIFYANGYYWMLYSGGGDPTGNHHPWILGLAYATTPTGIWTKHSSNPILNVGAGGTWEEYAAWRGSIYVEGDTYSGIYGGLNAGAAAAKGGNFTLAFS